MMSWLTYARLTGLRTRRELSLSLSSSSSATLETIPAGLQIRVWQDHSHSNSSWRLRINWHSRISWHGISWLKNSYLWIMTSRWRMGNMLQWRGTAAARHPNLLQEAAAWSTAAAAAFFSVSCCCWKFVENEDSWDWHFAFSYNTYLLYSSSSYSKKFITMQLNDYRFKGGLFFTDFNSHLTLSSKSHGSPYCGATLEIVLMNVLPSLPDWRYDVSGCGAVNTKPLFWSFVHPASVRRESLIC